jgi:hypothetical protein
MKNQQLYDEIADNLHTYQTTTPLPGLASPRHEDAFIRQLCDSIRRVKYIETIKARPLHPIFKDPHDLRFDPLKAAVLHMRDNDANEAFWLVFLFVHFGKNLRKGYNLLRSVYGKLDESPYWTWENTISDIDDFKLWLDLNMEILRSRGSFGNHRKFQSLKAYSNSGTGATIQSYYNLIGSDHSDFFSNISEDISNSPEAFFDHLLRLFSSKIMGFSRLAAFDFVTMLGKIGLLNVEPGSPYIQNATGPKDGTKLLYGVNNLSNHDLNECLKDLGNNLNFSFAMQVVEDAVCNWQKSPDKYIQFRG